jgi:hypothetical protein
MSTIFTTWNKQALHTEKYFSDKLESRNGLQFIVRLEPK